MEILQVKQVYIIYGEQENKVCALSNVSFSVEQGAFIAIVGTSGSGKSTLLNLIGGLYAQPGRNCDSGAKYRGTKKKRADDFPQEEHRIRVPELQPDACAECI